MKIFQPRGFEEGMLPPVLPLLPLLPVTFFSHKRSNY
jgi:hypothetical protein